MTDPAFLFYYRHWLSSTQRMDADARGWYIQLLCHQAENGSIPNDFDELFVLAGVKPSQMQRFSECWKHTLEAKFIADDEGGLVNSFLKDKINSRKEYTQKQANRGVVGAFIKRVKRDNNLNDSQLKELSTQLYEHDFVNLNKEERERCFKHTLEAFLQMQIQIQIKNNNNKGVSENSKEQPLMFQLKENVVHAYDTPSFKETWKQWLSHLQSNGKRLTDQMEQMMHRFISEKYSTPEIAIKAIEYAIMRGWKSFGVEFMPTEEELKNGSKRTNSKTNYSTEATPEGLKSWLDS